MEPFVNFLHAHKWAIICATAGVVIAILLLTIGFWKTLLITAIFAVCVLFGMLLDKDGAESLRTLFGKSSKDKEK